MVNWRWCAAGDVWTRWLEQTGHARIVRGFSNTQSISVTRPPLRWMRCGLGNGLWESTQFNSRLQPTQIALGTVQNGADKLKLEYGYGTTANNGNVLSQKITVKRPSQSDLVFDQIYTYDSLNRITSAEEKTGTTVNWNQTYMFDRYGNRNFNESLTTTLPKGCVDGWNPVMCVADRKVFNPELNPANNRMAANQGWAYDPAGNTTADPQGRTFTYDAENKQIEVKNSLSATVGQYFFDGDGKRVKKVVPTSGEVTIFIYDAGAKLIGEYSAIVQSVQDAKVQYLTNDHLGSPRINTDRDGNVTSRTDYFPYGEEIIALGGRSSADKYVADDVRQGFTGYERDVEIDLDFAQARYYSPKHGRFTSPDEVFADQYEENPQSWNLYSYVRNNPLNLVDPSGMKADCPPRKVCTYDENGKLLSVEDDKEPIVIETKVKRETQVGTADTMAIGGLIRPIIQWFIRFFTRSPKPRPAPAPKPPPQPQPPVQPPPVAPVSPPVPPHVQNVLNQIKNAGGKPPSGFKGGRIFKNDGRGGGQVLPKTDSAGNPIKYKEYDVNPYQKGVNGGAERLVRGTSDGKTYHTYYSNDHYRTFVKIE
jgi:RHS repeat-associated protein